MTYVVLQICILHVLCTNSDTTITRTIVTRDAILAHTVCCLRIRNSVYGMVMHYRVQGIGLNREHFHCWALHGEGGSTARTRLSTISPTRRSWHLCAMPTKWTSISPPKVCRFVAARTSLIEWLDSLAHCWNGHFIGMLCFSNTV